MDVKTVKAGWDAGRDIYLFGIPLIALLIFGFFRLDEVFSVRKNQTRETPDPSPTSQQHPKSMRSDPDGRPWDE